MINCPSAVRAVVGIVLLVCLVGVSVGCPNPKPPEVEPRDDGLGDIDLPDPEPEPEPEPPPEAGIVKLGPALMTGGAGMSTEAKSQAKEAFIAAFEQGVHLFRRCYAAALVHDAELTGGIDVEVVIKPDGSVYEVNLGDSEIDDPGMTRCVVRAFRKLRYQPLQDGELFSVTPVVKFRPE